MVAEPLDLLAYAAPSSEAADDELIARALGGDRESFAVLYGRYREPVRRMCLRYLRDLTAAEDVTQDTFLKAYTNLDRFEPGRPMLPWLTAIAHRRCIDLQRRGSRVRLHDHTDGSTWPEHADGDSTLDSVIAADDKRDLTEALARLPERQRRALLLFALEGWSYADIAASEGMTVTSTKALLFRARASLRASCRAPALGVLLGPIAWLRERAHRAAASVRARTSAMDGVALAGWAQPLTAMAVVLAIAGAPAGRAPAAIEPVAQAATIGTVHRLRPPAAAPRAQTPAAAVDTRPLAERLLDPARNATPDNSSISSFASNRDGTALVAAGSVPCAARVCAVLFVSLDGGRTWTRSQAHGLTGRTVLVSPAFPADPRIFAMGPAGLQVSTDGGDTFLGVHPLVGNVALPPTFADGDARVLTGGATVTEYRADLGTVTPAALLANGGTRATLAFSPSYGTDAVLFVGGIRPDPGSPFASVVQRCDGPVCAAVTLPGAAGIPSLTVSPAFARDGAVYAHAGARVYRSVDGGRTFTVAAHDFGGALVDLAVSKDGRSLFAATAGRDAGVYRSIADGDGWSRVRGFGGGAGVVHVTARGVVLAAGSEGIACSTDAGGSWSSRC